MKRKKERDVNKRESGCDGQRNRWRCRARDRGGGKFCSGRMSRDECSRRRRRRCVDPMTMRQRTTTGDDYDGGGGGSGAPPVLWPHPRPRHRQQDRKDRHLPERRVITREQDSGRRRNSVQGINGRNDCHTRCVSGRDRQAASASHLLKTQSLPALLAILSAKRQTTAVAETTATTRAAAFCATATLILVHEELRGFCSSRHWIPLSGSCFR